MKNFIGGLFKNKEDAEMARKALRENGFDEASISVLECTHDKKAVVAKNPSIGSIRAGALAGAMILGGIGAVIGLLVGLGVIPIPGLEPAGGATLPFQITWQFVLTSLAAGVILGGVTGALLGAATRLGLVRYREVDTGQTANKGDLMLAVQANDTRREALARSTMQEYGAVQFEEFKENWDTEVWSVFDEEVSQTR